MSDYLDQLSDNYQTRVQSVMSISQTTYSVIEITETLFNPIAKEVAASTTMPAPFKERVSRAFDQVQRLKESPSVSSQLVKINGQVLILLVSTTETFLYDLIKEIADNQPEILVWPTNKKISFSPEILVNNITPGEIVRHYFKEDNNVSFQDLQAILRFFDDYLTLAIDLDTSTRNLLILAAACRNCLVHNDGIIDTKFIHQIRDTTFSETYQKPNQLEISDALLRNMKNAFTDLVALILAKLEENE